MSTKLEQLKYMKTCEAEYSVTIKRLVSCGMSLEPILNTRLEMRLLTSLGKQGHGSNIDIWACLWDMKDFFDVLSWI